MTKNLYINKLDSIRGFAAFYIFLTHLVLILNFIPKPLKIFFDFGQEAVVIFFILSGFVMYLSVYNNPDFTFKHYFIKRFRRIYFPLILCMLISVLIVCFNGDFKEFPLASLVSNLLMLQDFSEVKPGVKFKPFLDNLPLWSLGYEWWFYMMFYPAYKWLSKLPHKIYLILFICTLSYSAYIAVPNRAALVISYFIIWWAGVEAAAVYTKYAKFTYRNMRHVLFSLIGMAVISVIPVLGAEQIKLGYYPFLMLRHFLDAYIWIVIGIFWYQNGLKNFDNIFGIFSKLAPFSYSLYILQYPLITKWNISNYISELWIVCLIKIVVIFGLSYLIDIKLQPIVNRLFK